MNILLIGLRGAGKSTVGRRLAERLALPFVDLDEIVLARFEESRISEVWAARGEDAWREAEARALERVLETADQVVALGGGTPMIERVRRALEVQRAAGRARVVYLRGDTSELSRRVRGDADRPSLTGADPADEMAAVRAVREPVFRRLADLEVDVTHTAPDEAAGVVAAWLDETASRPG